LTLNGFFVKARVAEIISRAFSAELAPTPIDPNPPALDTAAASSGVETPTIGA
jgi:hypothetical protein